MPVRLTPEKAADKLAERLTAATGAISEGVDRVTQAPGQKAAANLAKWVAKLANPEVQKKWQSRVGSVTLDEWKAAMKEKGIARIGSGIAGAKPKLVDFYNQLFPFQNNLLTKIDGMPNLTLEDSINRAATWIREMAKFKRK